MYQPGEKIQFGGSEWYVVDYNMQTATYRLQQVERDPLSPLRNIGSMGSPIAFGPPIRDVEVTAEVLEREQVSSTFERRKIEREMFEALARNGAGDISNSPAVRSIIGNVAEQMDAMMRNFQSLNSAARPAAEAVANLQAAFEQSGHAPGRRAEIDKEYSEPAADGWAVLWRRKNPRPGPGIRITIEGLAGDQWDVLGGYNCERCETVDDCWAFVDYLNDDEAGYACAIREDEVVVFLHEDDEWESLTQEEVPDAYR